MVKQTFVVTLEVPTPFDRYVTKVEAGQMANIIRDGIEAKGVSFMGSILFTLRVERITEAASTSGQMREYSPEEFPEIEEAVRKQAKTLEVDQTK